MAGEVTGRWIFRKTRRYRSRRYLPEERDSLVVIAREQAGSGPGERQEGDGMRARLMERRGAQGRGETMIRPLPAGTIAFRKKPLSRIRYPESVFPALNGGQLERCMPPLNISRESGKPADEASWDAVEDKDVGGNLIYGQSGIAVTRPGGARQENVRMGPDEVNQVAWPVLAPDESDIDIAVMFKRPA